MEGERPSYRPDHHDSDGQVSAAREDLWFDRFLDATQLSTRLVAIENTQSEILEELREIRKNQEEAATLTATVGPVREQL